MNPRYTPLFEVASYMAAMHLFPDPTAYLCKQHNEIFHFGEECSSCMSEEDVTTEITHEADCHWLTERKGKCSCLVNHYASS